MRGSAANTVNKTQIHVDGVQIEVDLGLEGEDCIVLLEAKARDMKDFIIRQLYYPYRRFTDLSVDKKVIPVFFTYEADKRIYNFWVYEFTNLTDYNSLRLLKTMSYHIVTQDEVELQDITPVDVQYKDIVPQANDLDKVMELVFKVSEGMNNSTAIAEYFSFDKRQSSYYREAAEALGLIDREGSEYILTGAGRYLVSLQTQERNLYFSQILSNFTLIREGLSLLKQGNVLNKTKLEELIQQHSILSGSTIPRRAHSLMSWYRWIAENTGALNVEGGEVKNAIP